MIFTPNTFSVNENFPNFPFYNFEGAEFLPGIDVLFETFIKIVYSLTHRVLTSLGRSISSFFLFFFFFDFSLSEDTLLVSKNTLNCLRRTLKYADFLPSCALFDKMFSIALKIQTTSPDRLYLRRFYFY